MWARAAKEESFCTISTGCSANTDGFDDGAAGSCAACAGANEGALPAVTPETGADGALTGGSAAATAVGATEGVSETGFAADSLDACTGYAAGAKETGCSALVSLVLVEASNDAGAGA